MFILTVNPLVKFIISKYLKKKQSQNNPDNKTNPKLVDSNKAFSWDDTQM